MISDSRRSFNKRFRRRVLLPGAVILFVTAILCGGALIAAGKGTDTLSVMGQQMEVMRATTRAFDDLSLAQESVGLCDECIGEAASAAPDHGWLDEKGIGSIVFSPLAQGMLTGKYVDGIPDGSRAARAEGFLQTAQVEAQIEKIRALNQIASERGMSLQHLALCWVLDQRAVTSAIIGARTVAQFDDSLAAFQMPSLDREALDLIDSISPAVKKEDAEG